MHDQCFVLIHGSWHTGFAWHKTEQALRAQGVERIFAPNLAGMEAGDQPAPTNVGLHTHIRQITDLIMGYGLDQVVLVGHSYAGFVIAGVADALPERLAALVFLDAFIPEHDQSVFDLLPAPSVAHMRSVLVDHQLRSRADGAQDVWLIPPSDPASYGVQDAADIELLRPHMVYTPIATFEEKLRLTNPQAMAVPHYFIRCTHFEFLAAYEHKAHQAGWPVYHIATGHDAMVTEPTRLAEILVKIGGRQR